MKDSVGNANGQIKRTGATFDAAGQLSLPGGTSSSSGADAISGYVDLPNGIIRSLHNATFEAWVTWEASGSSWQRIFDFGTSDGGEDVSDGYGKYLFLSPAGAANLRFALQSTTSLGPQANWTAVGGNPVVENGQNKVTVTIDGTAKFYRLIK